MSAVRDEAGVELVRGKQSIWQTLSSEKYFKWTLIIPLLLILAVFMFYPLFYCLFYSTQEWTVGGVSGFAGWDNYRYALRDPEFWKALGLTFQALVICIAVELVIGMAVASHFNREFRGQNVVRGLCLLPLLMSPLAMSLAWNIIVQYDFGAINQIIVALGGSKVNWWSPNGAIYTICLITIWQWVPFSIFVLLAGLRSLPRDSFEAARVDGASSWYTFRRLTLPMLTPLVLIIILLRTMWLIRLFDPLYGTTRGSANTELLDWMVYRVSFIFFDMSMGSTLGIISLVLTLVVCSILFRVLMKALGVIK